MPVMSSWLLVFKASLFCESLASACRARAFQ